MKQLVSKKTNLLGTSSKILILLRCRRCRGCNCSSSSVCITATVFSNPGDRGLSNGGNTATALNPIGTKSNATPATKAGAVAINRPPPIAPGSATPAGICPAPDENPCGTPATAPAPRLPKSAAPAPARSM